MGREPSGWHTASGHQTMMPPSRWAIPAGPGRGGAPGAPCTMQGTRCATPRSSSRQPPHGSTKGASAVGEKKKKTKTPHTKNMPYLTAGCSCCPQKEPGPQHNPLLPLVLALKHAFLQCLIYTSPVLSKVMPVQCQESRWCCRCVFQLPWNQELP